jgi:hypothetical protein
MKIKSIKLSQDNEADHGIVPNKITVEMSAAELAFISKLCGGFNSTTAEEAVPGLGSSSTGIYYGGAEVFNAFFDNGIDGAVRYYA